MPNLKETDSALIISEDGTVQMHLYKAPDSEIVPKQSLAIAAIGLFVHEHYSEIMDWFYKKHDEGKTTNPGD